MQFDFYNPNPKSGVSDLPDVTIIRSKIIAHVIEEKIYYAIGIWLIENITLVKFLMEMYGFYVEGGARG